jgi:hypothetical protein
VTQTTSANPKEFVIFVWTNTKNQQKIKLTHHTCTNTISFGHEIDFDNVVILDRADSVKKLELKEMLYIRKLKPTLNKQKESELFTLIIRNVKMENSITRDIQKYLKPKPRPNPKH